jgi:ClpP class serine protease
MDPLGLLWIILILLSFQPIVQQQVLAGRRQQSLARLARARGATVVTLIHRQETLSFLGIPLTRHIDLDDSEGVLRAIRATPPGHPIEIVLHTPGGIVLAATQIASALADHEGPVSAVVPYYAMSGGTLVALAADVVVMDRHAALGPVDPQVGRWPAASIVAALEEEGDHEDETRILGDISRKALRQMEEYVTALLGRKLPAERAADVARRLTTGIWTHDRPLSPADLEVMGLSVRVGVEEEERELLKLYPAPRGRISQVEYAPGSPPFRWRDRPRGPRRLT